MTVKVSDFGYDPEGSTRFLRQALESGAEKIILDRQSGPWVTLPLKMRSNTELVFDPGVELLAKRGACVSVHGKPVSSSCRRKRPGVSRLRKKGFPLQRIPLVSVKTRSICFQT